MIKADFHIHTRYCDGQDWPEEIVIAAIDKGLHTIGFSGHSPTSFDTSYAMSVEGARQYRADIAALMQKYGKYIHILCGVEQDYYSEQPTDDYDYVIGSVHYIQVGDVYVTVDESAATLCAAAEQYFAGDIYALLAAYYQLVGDVVHKTGADIIGHFDLVSKFNEDGQLFDAQDARYIHAASSAVQALLPSGSLFEVNTGAVFRGYCSSPYPAEWILRKINQGGGNIIFCGDVHDKAALCYDFASAVQIAKVCGFTQASLLTSAGRSSIRL